MSSPTLSNPGTLVHARGREWIVLTGSICVTAQDLLLAFMPVLGEERGIAPATVGFLLSLRAIASMMSRLAFSSAVHDLRVRNFTFVPAAGGALDLLLACDDTEDPGIYEATLRQAYAADAALVSAPLGEIRQVLPAYFAQEWCDRVAAGLRPPQVKDRIVSPAR